MRYIIIYISSCLLAMILTGCFSDHGEEILMPRLEFIDCSGRDPSTLDSSISLAPQVTGLTFPDAPDALNSLGK